MARIAAPIRTIEPDSYIYDTGADRIDGFDLIADTYTDLMTHLRHRIAAAIATQLPDELLVREDASTVEGARWEILDGEHAALPELQWLDEPERVAARIGLADMVNALIREARMRLDAGE